MAFLANLTAPKRQFFAVEFLLNLVGCSFNWQTEYAFIVFRSNFLFLNKLIKT